MSNKVRPVLKNLINSNTSDLERFQNEVIRPIIKMQNNLLTVFFKNYLRNRKIEFDRLKSEDQENKVKTILTKDINFKNILTGSIVGHFDENEIKIYLKSASELNKRIIQIVNQRLLDKYITQEEES